MSLDGRLPFQHETAQLVTREVHTTKVCEALGDLHILNLEFKFTKDVLILVIQIPLAHLNHTSLETLTGDFCTLGSCDQGTSACPLRENRRSAQLIPCLFGKWIGTKTGNNSAI